MKIIVKSLFEHYRQNLNALRTHPRVRFQLQPQRDDIVICPLCLKYGYTLSPADLHQLTIEHAPPHRLQGKGVALTCKTCNNNDGTHLDRPLIAHIRQTDTRHTANLPMPKQATYGLVRAAYLLAFRDMGYGYLYNKNLERVRSQFQHPKEEIIPLPAVRLLDAQPVPDSLLGVNIVLHPSGLKSFYLIFDIQIKDNPPHRIGVMLPGPIQDGYHWFESLQHTPPADQRLTIRHCPITWEDKLTDPLISHRLWNETIEPTGSR